MQKHVQDKESAAGITWLALLIIAGCWLLVAGCWLLVAGCWLGRSCQIPEGCKAGQSNTELGKCFCADCGV